MAKATMPRHTRRWLRPEGPQATYRLAADTTIHQGTLVQLNAAGLLIPASKAANQVTVGMAVSDAKSGAADDVRIDVASGVFLWDNLAADEIAAAEIGDACYVEDDQTVRKTSDSNGTTAGRIMQVTDAGVWVATGIFYNH